MVVAAETLEVEHAGQLRVAGEDVGRMHAVDGQRPVDDRAAGERVDAAREVHVEVARERAQRRVAHHEVERVAAEHEGRHRGPGPVAPVGGDAAHGVGRHRAQGGERQARLVAVDRAQQVRIAAGALADVGVQRGEGAEHEFVAERLEHVRAGEAERHAQRQVDEHVGGEEVRQHHVVGVEEGDVGRARRLEPLHGGERLAAVVGAPHHAHPREARRQRVDDGGAVVGRAVVEQHALEVGVGLREHGLDRRREVGGVVVVDDDHADARQGEGVIGRHARGRGDGHASPPPTRSRARWA